MIEGHGGILDRMDSVSFASPLFFHLTRYYFATYRAAGARVMTALGVVPRCFSVRPDLIPCSGDLIPCSVA